VRDPTGAGDSFAGGFLGYLAANGDLSEGAFRRAVVYGTAVASFVVERFSIDGLVGLRRADIDARVGELYQLSAFELAAQRA